MMKKITTALLVCLLFTVSLFAQEEITFKPFFSPQTTYMSTIAQQTSAEVKYTASAEFLKKLDDRGVKNPTVTTNASVNETLTITGKLDSKTDQFPVEIKYISTKSSDNKPQIPNGTTIFGHCKIGKPPVLDSIVSKGLTEDVKQSILNLVQQVMNKDTFLERKLKVGDEFSVETPLSLPIAGSTIEMNITTTYKLQSITNGMANFELNQKYNAKTLVSKFKFDATGSGKGKLVHDIANHINQKFEIENEMVVSANLDQLTMNLTTKGTYQQTTTIKK